ncbi:MAG: acyltransferase family protein [Hyphomonadaceae bacterium]
MAQNERVAWVDYAKGLCIILVVMMHCVLNYGDIVGARGWLHEVVDFARPFRMPDFFLLSGLFLGLSINSPLLDYIDRKVVHFAYFYLLWLAIQFGVIFDEQLLNDPAAWGARYAMALVEPTNTLWFVHMLAIFYIVTRMVRQLPKLAVLLVAAALQVGYQADIINSDWRVIEHFVERYVFFFAGYAYAPMIFGFARWVGARPALALLGLAVWALLNGALVKLGLFDDPLVGLGLGFLGASAIVAFGALMAGRDWAAPLRYAGRNSIVIYLSFFLPMEVTFRLLSGSGLIPDVGTATALITAVAVIAPLAFHWVIKRTPLNFLYVRPKAFRLPTYLSPRAQPAAGA